MSPSSSETRLSDSVEPSSTGGGGGGGCLSSSGEASGSTGRGGLTGTGEDSGRGGLTGLGRGLGGVAGGPASLGEGGVGRCGLANLGDSSDGSRGCLKTGGAGAGRVDLGEDTGEGSGGSVGVGRGGLVGARGEGGVGRCGLASPGDSGGDCLGEGGAGAGRAGLGEDTGEGSGGSVGVGRGGLVGAPGEGGVGRGGPARLGDSGGVGSRCLGRGGGGAGRVGLGEDFWGGDTVPGDTGTWSSDRDGSLTGLEGGSSTCGGVSSSCSACFSFLSATLFLIWANLGTYSTLFVVPSMAFSLGGAFRTGRTGCSLSLEGSTFGFVLRGASFVGARLLAGFGGGTGLGKAGGCGGQTSLSADAIGCDVSSPLWVTAGTWLLSCRCCCGGRYGISLPDSMSADSCIAATVS